MVKLQRMARYLVGAETVVWRFRGGGAMMVDIDVRVDSDWVGNRKDRKSTSGGVTCVGGQVVKTSASSQGSVAMSSGEAEYYALIKGAAEGLGLQAVMAYLGWEPRVKLWSYPSAARGMAEVKTGTWRSSVCGCITGRTGRIPVWRNAADVMTKYSGAAQMKDIVAAIGGVHGG